MLLAPRRAIAKRRGEGTARANYDQIFNSHLSTLHWGSASLNPSSPLPLLPRLYTYPIRLHILRRRAPRLFFSPPDGRKRRTRVDAVFCLRLIEKWYVNVANANFSFLYIPPQCWFAYWFYHRMRFVVSFFPFLKSRSIHMIGLHKSSNIHICFNCFLFKFHNLI